MNNQITFPIGELLFLKKGKEVPVWLDSFAGYVVQIGRKRIKLSVPVNDDKEMWVSTSQLSLTDPWDAK